MKKTILALILVMLTFSACSSVKEDVVLSGFVDTESQLFFDFGNINIEGGLIDHSFIFTNDSESELLIKNLFTSCGCTAAEVELSDGTRSPKFGMNDSSTWGQVVAPGEEFEVVVTYDPMAHGPNATGEMNRSVIMVSSSEENGRTAVLDPATGYSFTQINIRGMVLSQEDFLSEE